MKKALAVFLCVALALTSLVVAMAADPKITCTVSDTDITMGETFTVTVSISDYEAIRSGAIALNFDQSALQFVEGEWLIGAGIESFDPDNLNGIFMFFPAEPHDINGDIFRFTLRALADASSAGEFNITVTPQLINGDGNNAAEGSSAIASVQISCAEHEYGDLIPEVPAKCGTAGKKAYYECSVCHKLFDETKTEVSAEQLVIPALTHVAEEGWHSDGDNHWKLCINDSCGQVIDGTTTSHSFEWVVDTPATEDAPGVRHEECTVCEYTRNENTEIPQLPHVHTGITHHEAVAANCHETGTVEYWTCSSDKCAGKYYGDADCSTELASITTPIDPDNHAGGTEVRNAVEATCSENGYTGDTYCLGCGEKIADGTVIPATGKHVDDNGEWESNDTDHWHTCGVCGTTFDKAAHEGGEANCHEKAVCEVCGSAYGELNPDNHTGGTEIRGAVEATCNADGYTGDTYCLGCGEKITTGTVIPATGKHVDDNDAWESDGTDHWHTCGVCGTTFDKAAHEGGEATCSDKAVCSVCGTEYGELDPDNHVNTEIRNAVAATEEAEGYTGDTYCLDCGKKTAEGTVVPKLDHTHEMVKTEAKAATCEEDGNIEYYTCSKCGKKYNDAAGTRELTEEEILVKASGHSYGTDWESDKENHWHACACGERTDVAAHSFGDWTIAQEATETTDGSRERECNVCGYTQTEVILATGPDEKPDENEPGGTDDSSDEDDAKVPPTGENNAVLLFLALLSVSGCGLIITATAKKKCKTNK